MCHSRIRGRRSMWPIPVSVSPLFSLSFTLFDRKNRRRNRYEVGRLASIALASNVARGGSVNRPYLMKMSPMEKTAREIAQRLRAADHIAYFAGGCVRDMVRSLAAKDFDVATDATPDIVQKIFSHTYAVGAHFGVVVVVENGFNFEVATFRSDGAYLDHRHPVDVRFSSPEEDAKRRDFTINGMFFDPEKNEVIDFVGGRADLEAKLVRAIGDPAARFAEDRLRMLRAVRFATVLDYKIDNRTWNALVANAASINEISAERIREELLKIFLSPNRVRGWDQLDRSGLLRAILPELDAMKGCLQPEQFHPEGDVFQHTRLMLENYEFLLRKREEFANEPIIPPPLVRGDDLIALGMKPGPKFGEILEAVETLQLEGVLKDREEALDWVKREYSPGQRA